MISTRVDKLKFMVEEMHLVLHLSMHLTEPFLARTIARHILIRTENFIEHARALRKPLNDAGYKTHEFHKTKEVYASAFDEYFKVARHRLGAHVQDLDFGRRIELWNDIEITKIGYFVEGAQEIYQGLAVLNLPGYTPYAAPPELIDPIVLGTLHQFQHSSDDRTGVELGVDSLATARNNTVAVLNLTPVHARASQLALIRRWIAIQSDLFKRFSTHSRIAHILKARVITDLVSFCDCLVTRPVPPGALQAMDGLDRLITASGESSAPINNFVTTSNFLTELLAARIIRDSIGAHLEIDETHSIASLLVQIDGYDLSTGLKFYERLEAVFSKVCHSVLFLRMYAADGRRIYGISAGQAPALAYAENSAVGPIPPPEPPQINNIEAYGKELRRWLDGDDTQKEHARQFFWHAFLSSEIVETIEERENVGSGYRMSMHELKRAHQFLYSILTNELSDDDFKGTIDLAVSCRNGSPYPLTEVLVRRSQNVSEYRQWLICNALGEIGNSPHASASDFLQSCLESPNWSIRLEAALACFKTFVKTEGLFRANHRGQIKDDYKTLVDSLMANMNALEKMICLLAFASILGGPSLGSFSRPFQSNYAELQREIESLYHPLLKDDREKSKTTALSQLIKTNDYIGVCVLVALDLGEDDPLRSELIDYSCGGVIATAGHNQSLRHLAMCLLLKKEHRAAYEVADGLASRNPDWLDIQVLVAEILIETPGAREEAAEKIANLRRGYKLAGDIESRVVTVEQEIENLRANDASST